MEPRAKITRTHVLGLVAVLALVGAGAAFAVSRGADQAPERAADQRSERPGRAFHHHGHRRGAAHFAIRETFAAAADYVGLSREELLARLRRGQSLAEIAEAEGKSVDGLKRAIRDAITARLDAVVDDLVHRSRGMRG